MEDWIQGRGANILTFVNKYETINTIKIYHSPLGCIMFI